jgi:hypothetical protein
VLRPSGIAYLGRRSTAACEQSHFFSGLAARRLIHECKDEVQWVRDERETGDLLLVKTKSHTAIRLTISILGSGLLHNSWRECSSMDNTVHRDVSVEVPDPDAV